MYKIPTTSPRGSPNRYTPQFQQQQQQQSPQGQHPQQQQQPPPPPSQPHQQAQYHYQFQQQAPPPPSHPHPAPHTGSQNGYRYNSTTTTTTSAAYTASPVYQQDEDENIEDGTAYYEKNRIKLLQDERVYIQKKTFTKWCNSYLNKVRFLSYNEIESNIVHSNLVPILGSSRDSRPLQGFWRRYFAHEIP